MGNVEIIEVEGDRDLIISEDIVPDTIIVPFTEVEIIDSNSISIIGGSDLNHVHDQGVASDIWNINHNLNKFASVTVVDSAGSIVEGCVTIIDSNNVTINFSSSFSGKAFFN